MNTINSAKDGRNSVTTKRSVSILGMTRSESFPAGMSALTRLARCYWLYQHKVLSLVMKKACSAFKA